MIGERANSRDAGINPRDACRSAIAPQKLSRCHLRVRMCIDKEYIIRRKLIRYKKKKIISRYQVSTMIVFMQ